MIPENESIEIIRAVQVAADAVGSQYFMIGAMARDIRLKKWFDRGTLRSTNDVDFVFAVRDWQHYESIRNALLSRSTHDFLPDAHQKQRILFRKHFPVDLVPFGPIADKNGQLFWPPDRTPRMTVLGLEDALATADPVTIGNLEVKIATVPALGLLKLIAWNDRPAERPDDIEDFATFLKAYQYIADIDRLSTEGLLNDKEFDHSRASFRLFGRDVGRTVRIEATGALLAEILHREVAGPKYNLVSILSRFFRNDLDRSLEAIASFERGVLELLQKNKSA